jgi:pilus assembly protein CpaB
VLATGKITGTTNVNLIPESQREYSNVTLMVIPEEAEILTLAAELGNLTLSLRNEEDVDIIEERGRATISTLLSGERTRVLERKRQEIIQIIKGSASEKSAATGAP